MRELALLLQRVPLFEGFSVEEIKSLLETLAPADERFERGETLLMAGAAVHDIGVVLEGEIEAYKLTREGERFTVAHMGAGGVFGDVLSGGETRSPVTVVGRHAGRLLRIPYPKLLASQGGDSALYRRLLANLVRVVSAKYFALDRRIDLLLTKGVRRKVAAYLCFEAERRGSLAFTIAFNRAELADYLGCERSALSRELSRMASAGLIETKRGAFRLLDLQKLRASR